MLQEAMNALIKSEEETKKKDFYFDNAGFPLTLKLLKSIDELDHGSDNSGMVLNCIT